jgi:hypothetical protein
MRLSLNAGLRVPHRAASILFVVAGANVCEAFEQIALACTYSS